MCLAQSVECPGFTRQFKWSNKHEVLCSPAKKPRQATSSQSNHAGSPLESPTHNGLPRTDSVGNAPPGYDHQQATSAVIETQDSLEDADNVEDVLEWPNFELCGYEDLAFSTPLLGPSLGLGPGTGLVPPFFGDLQNAMPRLSELTDESMRDCNALNTVHIPSELKDVDEVQARGAQVSDSANLLQTFYRLSLPREVPGFSDEDLVGHYFNSICTIFCCFDSDLNPFRSLVADLWTEERTVFLIIQSMAVGHLTNYYPYMANLGISKRSQAWLSLQVDLQKLRGGKGSTDSVLLCLLLFGISASWLQTSSLGLQYLYIARNIMQSRLQEQHPGQCARSTANDDFFSEAVLYWEMISSFVDPVPLLPLIGLRAPALRAPTRTGPTVPHPWTGVMKEVHFAFAEIGRILRRQRSVASTVDLSRHRDGLRCDEDAEWASSLERFLLYLTIPTAEDVADFGDPKTPALDLIRAHRAYRDVGVLEIYSTYPILLQERITNGSLDLGEDFVPPAERIGYASDVDSWLTSIATHVINSVKLIPISSAACRFLPLLLLASASQLRFPDCASPLSADSSRHDEIVNARFLVEARMLVLSRKYPQRPLMQMIDIVKEVWSRLDAGADGAHWMVVAHEKCWQTIMG